MTCDDVDDMGLLYREANELGHKLSQVRKERDYLLKAIDEELDLCFCEEPQECRWCVRMRAAVHLVKTPPVKAAISKAAAELVKKMDSDTDADSKKEWTSPKKRAELDALYRERCTDLEQWENEAEELMKQMGKDAVRVCEGGAAENVRASLVVSVSRLLSDRRHLVSRLTECVKYQPHSPDCHSLGRELPPDRFSLEEDLYPSRGPPGPCDCWRSKFFKALGVTT